MATQAGMGGFGPMFTGISFAPMQGPLASLGQVTSLLEAKAPSIVGPKSYVYEASSCSVKVHVPDIVETAALLSDAPMTFAAVEKSAP
jgi:hypothetical protein